MGKTSREKPSRDRRICYGDPFQARRYYFFYPLLSIVALGVGGTAINKKTVSGLRKVLTGVGVTLAVIGFILYLMILPAALAWTRFR